MSLIHEYGRGTYVRGASMITYAHGAGGRICDLPPRYLDMVAEAIIHGHPRYVTHAVRELLVSGRFARSRHWQLRNLTLAELRLRASASNHEQWKRRCERHPEKLAKRRVAKAAKRVV